jgi:hypothetical protein
VLLPKARHLLVLGQKRREVFTSTRNTGQSSALLAPNRQGWRHRDTKRCLPLSKLGRNMKITCALNFTHSYHSALPASVLDEEEDDDDDDDDTVVGDSRDDERSGTKYNVRE